jgi:hypothetical protein
LPTEAIGEAALVEAIEVALPGGEAAVEGIE